MTSALGCGPASVQDAPSAPAAPSAPPAPSPTADAGTAATAPTPVPEKPLAACPSGIPAKLHDLGAPSIVLGDVTGDGVDDWMTLNWSDSAGRLVAGPLPGTTWARVGPTLGAPQNAHAADLDGDGNLDLMVVDPWFSQIAVFYGPVEKDATLDFASAPLLFRGLTDTGGLADLFGVALEVADVTGDGIADVVIGAPSEEEEACSGTQDTVVFPGPHPRPATADRTRWASDAPIRLPATLGECLGKMIVATRDVTGDGVPDLVVSSARDTFVYGGPLSAAALNNPTKTFDRPLSAVHDLRGTNTADLVFADGATRSFVVQEFGGPSHPVSVGGVEDAFVILNPAGRRAQAPAELFAITAYAAEPALYLFPKGPAFEAPLWAAKGLGEYPRRVSGGDLDGDGRLDLVFNRIAMTCP